MVEDWTDEAHSPDFQHGNWLDGDAISQDRKYKGKTRMMRKQ